MNNHYDVASYKRLCGEFGIDPSSDCRYTHGPNHGLGTVNVYASGPAKTDYQYPGWNKFSDEGGKAIQGDLIYSFSRTLVGIPKRTGSRQTQPPF